MLPNFWCIYVEFCVSVLYLWAAHTVFWICVICDQISSSFLKPALCLCWATSLYFLELHSVGAALCSLLESSALKFKKKYRPLTSVLSELVLKVLLSRFSSKTGGKSKGFNIDSYGIDVKSFTFNVGSDKIRLWKSIFNVTFRSETDVFSLLWRRLTAVIYLKILRLPHISQFFGHV